MTGNVELTSGRAGWTWWAGATVPFLLALTLYGWAALQSPLLDRRHAEQDRFLAAVAQATVSYDAVDTGAATAYWERYPDVVGDAYYGPSGPLGVRGALQHYRDHGRGEGRHWGR